MPHECGPGVAQSGWSRLHAPLRWNLGTTSCRAKRCAKHRREMIPAQSARSTDIKLHVLGCQFKRVGLWGSDKCDYNYVASYTGHDVQSSAAWDLKMLQMTELLINHVHFETSNNLFLLPQFLVPNSIQIGTISTTIIPDGRCKAEAGLRTY